MKKYAYEPMNATEFYLHEIARNTEEIAELLKRGVKDEIMEGVEKEIAQIIPEVVEEVKVEAIPASKRKRAPRKV